jgi:hypothetical protein
MIINVNDTAETDFAKFRSKYEDGNEFSLSSGGIYEYSTLRYSVLSGFTDKNNWGPTMSWMCPF